MDQSKGKTLLVEHSFVENNINFLEKYTIFQMSDLPFGTNQIFVNVNFNQSHKVTNEIHLSRPSVPSPFSFDTEWHPVNRALQLNDERGWLPETRDSAWIHRAPWSSDLKKIIIDKCISIKGYDTFQGIFEIILEGRTCRTISCVVIIFQVYFRTYFT